MRSHKCHCEEECDSMSMDFAPPPPHHHPHHHKMSECCHIPKVKMMKCGPTKECVKTFKCCYKLYKITHYRLFKVCETCGGEFDHYHHGGMCPKCK